MDNRIELTAYAIRTLCWSGDTLVDWENGLRISLDGTRSDRQWGYGYRFDRAVMSPSGRYAVIYEQRGTKGLGLEEGRPLREINRSYYHADVFEYPIARFTLPGGRRVIAHGPE